MNSLFYTSLPKQFDSIISSITVLFEKRTTQLFLLFSAGVLFAYLFFLNAWVVDDAYITFRTIDNFLHGYGLRWNIEERVQAYTHPLWMFLIIGASYFTADVFYTSIIVSFVCCAGALLLACLFLTSNFHIYPWKAAALVIALCTSKAFLDYTTSGLENALSYLLAALFLRTLIAVRDAPLLENKRRLSFLFLYASLAFVNRQDTLLLYLPALVYVFITARLYTSWRLFVRTGIAFLPAILWMLFSILYYGFPFPNTAYAKLLSTRIPFSIKVQEGIYYFANSMGWDSLSYVLILFAIILTWKQKDHTALLMMGGVFLFFLYILVSAASATHMSGRFFSVPFFIALILFLKNLNSVRGGVSILGLCLVYLFIHPLSAFHFGTLKYIPPTPDFGFIDTKWYAALEGTALIEWNPHKKFPDHQWFRYGEALRSSPVKVHLGGPPKTAAIGYFGYSAGPKIFIIDTVGLSDPLLARLPAVPDTWSPGHFSRIIPDGYIQSIEQNSNCITDKKIHEYYDKIRIITRGDIFTWERLKTIWFINLGCYNFLIDKSDNEIKEKNNPYSKIEHEE